MENMEYIHSCETCKYKNSCDLNNGKILVCMDYEKEESEDE